MKAREDHTAGTPGKGGDFHLGEMQRVPRLLYVGDVPVVNSFGGAVQLYRLLSPYPRDRLLLCCPMPAEAERLPGARYCVTNAPWPCLLTTRVGSLYCGLITAAYRLPIGRAQRAADDFGPDAVLSVSQTGGWTKGWNIARRLGVPFLLVAHDDWTFANYLPHVQRAGACSRFADAYRNAAARFCISPAMQEAYESRYGVASTLLLPMRDAADRAFGPVAPRVGEDRRARTSP